MGLMDDLTDPDKLGRKYGDRCTVCALIDTLEPQEAAALTATLAQRKIPAASIARILNDNGHDIKGYTVNRHRNQCRATR